MDIKPQERKKPRSFTLTPSTLAMINHYANLRGSNASQVMEAMAAFYLPRLIDIEEAKPKGNRRKR